MNAPVASERVKPPTSAVPDNGGPPPGVRMRRRGLLGKYVLALIGLVSVVLLVNAALDLWFAYRDTRASLAMLQREKAEAAAHRVEQFVTEIERQVGWTTHAQWSAGPLDQRRLDYERVISQARAVSELAQIDSNGKERLKVSRVAMNAYESGADWSSDPRFTEAMKHKVWFSPVYFRKESEPYMSVAVAHRGRNGGVTVAEVNLKLILEVVSAIKIGKAGYVYVVDQKGRLIAHPDISLVLRKIDMTELPQVRAARFAGQVRPREALSLEDARTLGGQRVLSAVAPIAALGWLVFVDLPLAEALEPLTLALARAGALLGLGLILATIAAFVLARRMVVPVQALATGAARLGQGELGHRIEARTGDEIEALAGEFNRMAQRLQESYAGLEQKVAERTHELREALEHQTATGDVLKVISRSTFDLKPVLQAVLETAMRLCPADVGEVWQLEGGAYRLSTASANNDPRYLERESQHALLPDRGSVVGRAVAEGRPVHVLDALSDPDYVFKTDARIGGVRSMIGVPLLRDGRVIGALALARQNVEPFTTKQIELVSVFADQAVIAIGNVRLLEELRSRTDDLARSVEELRVLGEVSQAVGSTLDLDTVLTTIIDRAVTLSEADAGMIYRYDRAQERFRLRHSVGLSEAEIARIRGATLAASGTSMGEAILNREPVQIADLAALASNPLRDLALAEGFRASLIVPLVGARRTFGTLVVRRRIAGAFPAATVNLLRNLASQSVLAIQNARLFRDIEEQGRQLAIASQHKSQFLANMSHELRTPLNAILGYTELLTDGIYGELPEKQRGVLDRVQANGRHLLGLINDVLDLSKIEAGQLKLALEDYAMPSVVQSVVAATESLAAAKGLKLVTSVVNGLPPGRGDERRLAQVLLNLVGNAIKFTEQGSVEIRAATHAGHFELAVADTGPGISPEDQLLIFEEFQQVDNTSTRKKGGTGLGLAISRRIVELHGGRLSVESDLGKGSTFHVRLPIRVEQQVAA
jgi:signal transduction histidine kinase